MPLDEILDKVAATLPYSVSVNSVTIPSDPSRSYQIALSKPRRSSAFADPYTGQVLGRSERGKFLSTTMRLHRWLLGSMKPGGGVSTGKLIVGISTIIFVITLITGIVIWIPRTRKAFKNSLKISVRKGMKRFWYDLHIAGGMYAVILLLAMALTGLTWSFSWYRTGFYKVFGVETASQQTQQTPSDNSRQGQQQADNGGGRQDRNEVRENAGADAGGGQRQEKTSPYRHWQHVYDEVNTRNPGFNRITISKGAVTVSYKGWGHQRASDRYTFDQASGDILSHTPYEDQQRSGKLRGWIYSIHVGSWGGIFSKVITFLAAVLGGTLPLTGYYIWIRKYYNKRKAARKRAAIAQQTLSGDIKPT